MLIESTIQKCFADVSYWHLSKQDFSLCLHWVSQGLWRIQSCVFIMCHTLGWDYYSDVNYNHQRFFLSNHLSIYHHDRTFSSYFLLIKQSYCLWFLISYSNNIQWMNILLIVSHYWLRLLFKIFIKLFKSSTVKLKFDYLNKIATAYFLLIKQSYCLRILIGYSNNIQWMNIQLIVSHNWLRLLFKIFVKLFKLSTVEIWLRE